MSKSGIVVGISSDVDNPDSVIVSMYSVLLNLDNDHVEFVLCLPNIDGSGLDKIYQIADSTNCTFKIIDYQSEFHELNVFNEDQVKNIPVECFAKLFLLRELINNYDSGYYLNNSILADTDISKIKVDDNHLIAVVVDSFSMENRTSVLKHLYELDYFSNFIKNPLQYPYFNTGFMVFNFKKCRELQIWDQVYNLFKINCSLPYADQDLLNAVFQRYTEFIEYLPPHYNVFCSSSLNHEIGHVNGYYSQEETISAYHNPKIYHYAGPEKPWFYPICNYFDKWWEYAAKTPVFEELMCFSSSMWSREVKLHIGTLKRLKKCENDLSNRMIVRDKNDFKYDDVIDVVLTGDNAYVMPLSVVMTSILENVRPGIKTVFHLFVSGFSEDDEYIIDKLKDRYCCDIEYTDVNKYMGYFDGADTSTFTNGHVSMACYYRLLIFKILSDDIESCFYVDGDMIVATDLYSLKERINSHIASVVVESYAMEHRTTILSHVYHLDEFSNFVSNPIQNPYFNAGFMQINLKKCREEKIWEQLLELFHKDSTLPFADQDMLNAILGQKYRNLIDFLPPAYNVFCASTLNHNIGHTGGYYSQEETIEAYAKPLIYHYAGPEKPWSYPICQYFEIWWKYASISPMYQNAIDIASNRWAREVKLHIGTLARLKELESAPSDVKQSFNIKVKNALLRDAVVKDIFDTRIREGYYKKRSKVRDFLRLSWINLNKQRILDTTDHIKLFKYDDKHVRKEIMQHECISFDIYDTLVCRPFEDPLDIFRLIEDKYDFPGFFKERLDADRRARSKHPELQDITIGMIYEEILPQYVDCMDLELELETRYTIANVSIQKLFKYAQKLGKKVVLVSDMYLPKDTVEEVLTGCGYDGPYKLFLSSETTKLKRTGDAFELMIDDVNLTPNKILHIGDNYELDYLIAKSKGIDAICIKKNSESLLDFNCCFSTFYKENKSINSSILIGLLSLKRNDAADYWERFGYSFAGPVVYAYMKWLNDALSADGLKTVYFIARDGYILEKALNLLYPGKYNTRYVYAPRRVSNICNLDLDLKFSYGDWTSEFADSIYQNYLPDDVKTAVSWSKLSLDEKNKVIKENTEYLMSQSLQKKDQYAKYVNGLSEDSTIAMIDSTTTFFSSQKLLQSVLCNKRVIGYYWVINSHTYDDGEVPIENQRNFMTAHENHIRDWDVMEFILTSPEPPIVDVDDSGNPQFKDVNANDRTRIDVFPRIAEGALNFVKDCISYNLLDVFTLDEHLIENYINNWIDNPSEIDKTMFKPMKLPVRCEHDEYVQIFKPWYSKDL